LRPSPIVRNLYFDGAQSQACQESDQIMRELLSTFGHRAPILICARNRLAIARSALYRAIIEGSDLDSVRVQIDATVEELRHASVQDYIVRGILTQSWVSFLTANSNGAQADLDEAWDIAERGPMRLHIADIHLHRARLFFREEHYPWKSPQDDLAAAEKLINDCGYHRRDEELADAKCAILG
jgi:hypothetical protein